MYRPSSECNQACLNCRVAREKGCKPIDHFQRALSQRSPLGAEGGGFEPPVREPVRQFSKLLVSATHPSFQKDPGVRNRGVISLIAGAKVRTFSETTKSFADFFRKKLLIDHNSRQIRVEIECSRLIQAVCTIAHPDVE